MNADEIDRNDRRIAQRATGMLARFNEAGVLDVADVHVAMRLGRLGDESDERVLLAVALTVRALRSGSVCLDLSTVSEGFDEADVHGWPPVEEWFAAIEDSDLVGEEKVLRWSRPTLYLDRYWHEEGQVCADLLARLADPAPSVDESRLAELLAAYFPEEEYADQRSAVEMAVANLTSVITGGPGSGKTTTIARLLAVLCSLEDPGERQLRIALAAPTGKAAARMAQAVQEAAEEFPAQTRDRLAGLGAATLHRLLGSRPDNRTRFRHNRGNRLPHDVVIVDETSMLPLTMMARLVEAMRPDARLILVGDADQLASVDAGAVLRDLVEGLGERETPIVGRLGGSRRYGHAIAELAAAVNSGDADAVLELLHGGAEEISLVRAEELAAYLRPPAIALAEAAESDDRAAAIRALDAHRLLCAHREGPFGVAHWNREIETLLKQRAGTDWLPQWYAGQPLIVNANDYGLGLFNGDTGVVCRDLSDPGAGLIALIADGEHPEGRAYSLTRMSDVSTAHAITVHRSQGSQFEEVTVMLPDPDSKILTRELLYTAVTRARSRVRVVGSEEALRVAIGRSAQRASGLATRLTSLSGHQNPVE